MNEAGKPVEKISAGFFCVGLCVGLITQQIKLEKNNRKMTKNGLKNARVRLFFGLGYQTFNGNACSQSVWFVLQLEEDRKKRRERNADSWN